MRQVSAAHKPKLYEQVAERLGEAISAGTLRAGDRLPSVRQLSASERNALVSYMGPGPIDLFDYDTQNAKLNGLFALVLQSPAYQVH